MLLSQVLRDQDAVLDARKLQAAAFSRYTESTQMLTAQLQAMIGFYGREGLPHVLHVPEEAREAFVDYWEQAIEAFEAPSKDYPALAADALQRYTMFPISDEDKVIWAQLTAGRPSPAMAINSAPEEEPAAGPTPRSMPVSDPGAGSSKSVESPDQPMDVDSNIPPITTVEDPEDANGPKEGEVEGEGSVGNTEVELVPANPDESPKGLAEIVDEFPDVLDEV